MRGEKTPYTRVEHPFPPVYDAFSRILILGSLPSVKSREEGFFYGHPKNRFWPLMARLLGEPTPTTIEEKQKMLLIHRVALWDAVYSCEIRSSSDASIRNAVPTPLAPIVAASEIRHVFCNGKAAGAFYARFHEKALGISAVVLPSTSPANAAWTMEKLAEAWRVICPYLEK